MLFNSFSFILFFITTTFIYYISPQKFRWIIILLSSLIFYIAWNPIFILLIFFSTFINWLFAIKIYKLRRYSNSTKKFYLIITLIINFAVLFFFKYLNFFYNILNLIINYLGIDHIYVKFNTILPLGISFYTFQLVSYIVDIYNNRYKPEKNFFKLTLFVLFFPPLIAGPIERADKLLPQFFLKHKFSLKNISLGLKFMIMGFFKKIVIADRLSQLVKTVYDSPNNFNSLSLVIATLLFSIQIYCDFSGYTDIAIGCSKTLGINLTENFKKPYLSKSIKEFWHRWHISLSTWFKDYLYIPLGGSRCSIQKTYINIFITFLISGIWHGANYTFIIWGILHGFYQIIENLILKYINKFLKLLNIYNNLIVKFIKTLITFLLISFTWIFFRAKNIQDAIYISSNLFNDISSWSDIQYIYDTLLNLNINFFEILLVILSVFILILSDIYSKDSNIHIILNKKPLIIRYSFYYIITFLVITLGAYYNAGEFIYFKF